MQIEWLEKKSSSDSTDDLCSTIANISDAIKKGDFCLTKLQGKKTEHFCVAEITDVKVRYVAVTFWHSCLSVFA